MIKESDMTVGTLVIDPWYFTGESGAILSVKEDKVRVQFGNVVHVYDRENALKLLSVKRG